jgi:hypothetical protein
MNKLEIRKYFLTYWYGTEFITDLHANEGILIIIMSVGKILKL